MSTLRQNHPNPVHTTTTIDFTLSVDGNATIDVLDERGAVVDVIADRSMRAGDHSVLFDARGLASGVYHYRIRTSAGAASKRFVVVR